MLCHTTYYICQVPRSYTITLLKANSEKPTPSVVTRMYLLFVKVHLHLQTLKYCKDKPVHLTEFVDYLRIVNNSLP
jgi:hypothetical protein